MNNGTKNIPKTQRIYRRTVSKVFRDILVETFPRLNEREHYWPLLSYLLFPTQVKDGKILLARDTMAELFGYSSIPSYFNSGRMFRGFAEAVQKFTWSDFSKVESRARVVESLIWPKEINKALELERKKLFHEEGRVYLISGYPFSKKKQNEFMKQEKFEASALTANNKETQLLLAYMNSIPNNLYAYLIKRNGGRALDAILNLDSDIGHQWSILSSIVDDYNQLYKPSQKTVRIFPFGERIVSLKSEIRRALTHGLIEADLKSSQFAIAATLWDIPSVKQFLSKGGSMWEYLYQLGSTDKDKLKKVLYSLMFGMHYRGIMAQLEAIGVSYEDFISLSLIHDLLKARNREINRIKQNNGATTCFGQFLSIKDHDVKSILAQCCQAMELKLLLPVIELAIENKDRKHGFTIALWQHDGFTLHTKSSQQRKYWIEFLSNTVLSTTKANGIITQLCWKEI